MPNKSTYATKLTASQNGTHAIPPIVSFVGRSNCGKTTLLEKLIPALAQRGYRIAVVKHTHHREVETDILGTDTRRLWDAGPDHVAFVTPNRVVHTHRYGIAPSLAEALRGIHDVDIILMEGYKAADAIPKIEVVRSACDPQPIPELKGRIAYITDIPNLNQTLPCFKFEDPENLLDFIEKNVINRSQNEQN